MTIITDISQALYKCFMPGIRRERNSVKNPEADEEDIITRLRTEIEATSKLCCGSTTKNKVTAVNTFERFVKETYPTRDRLTARELTEDHFKAFEHWGLDTQGRDWKPSYMTLHMRCLRALLSRIIGEEKAATLFRNVRTSNCQTEKRAVSEATITRLRDTPLQEGTAEAVARDIFLVCFYGFGIPLVDAARLRKSQLKNGILTFYRKKTRRKVTIEVGPELASIIERLTPKNSPYLLPIIDPDCRAGIDRQYKRFYQRYSRALGKVSARLGSEVHLTSYVARHSWASIAYSNGIDVNIIARALGHASTKVTYAYLRDISDASLFQASQIVCSAVR